MSYHFSLSEARVEDLDVRPLRPMCHFLTLSVPQQSIPEVPDEFHRLIRFTPHRNASVTQHTPPGWTSFLAVSGACSCGFYHARPRSGDDTTRLIAKYRKKGWSDAKIRRAVANRPPVSAQSSGFRDDLRDLISKLLKDQKQLRISLHWYSGDTESEIFSLNDLGTVSLATFLKDPSTFTDESTIKITQAEPADAGRPMVL